LLGSSRGLLDRRRRTMKSWIMHRPLLRMLLVGTALFATATGIALATIPGSDGVISACYVKDGLAGAGKVRVIDAQAGKVCKATENALSWNQRGPQGPQGPQGQQG